MSVIAATNQNLIEYVNEGKFRMDLYFRLNVIRLNTIPLRDRLADLPLMVDHFLKTFSLSFSKKIEGVFPQVMLFFQVLLVRELRNVLERCVNFTRSPQITVDDIPPDLFNKKTITIPHQELCSQEQSNQVPASVGTVFPPSYNSFADFEKQQILSLMMKYKGNKTAVAKELDIARRTLYSRLKKYGIH
ncbi:helix-turn-helix domain-containing protein [Desulfitobacterium hafniense]